MTHLTVAFASIIHARDAIAFLTGSSLAVSAAPRPSQGDAALALVDIDIPTVERDRLGTLLAGVHAIVVEEIGEARRSAA